MPSVTVGPPFRARALPIAITQSPTFGATEAIFAAGSLSASIFRTARSVAASLPTISAS